MERLTLGKVGGKGSQTLSWKDAMAQGILTGTWLLRYLFLPSKFPTGALIIESSGGVRVKKSISPDMLRDVARFLGLSKVKPALVKGLVVFVEDGEYYLERSEVDEGHGYVFTGTYFVYKRLTDIDILSEDF